MYLFASPLSSTRGKIILNEGIDKLRAPIDHNRIGHVADQQPEQLLRQTEKHRFKPCVLMRLYILYMFPYSLLSYTCYIHSIFLVMSTSISLLLSSFSFRITLIMVCLSYSLALPPFLSGFVHPSEHCGRQLRALR